ncbi:MAG TPA: L,D-transpeptidase family protein [Stellaceae bacterium]|nr:L,D-transpeptidase family protein [Stellaceae bacterium]
MRARHRLFAFLILTAAALASAAAPAEPPLKADRIVVEKSRHLLTLFSGGRVLRRYRVALGAGGLGPKRRQGDARVPEGHYVIDWRNPNSAYHLALHISYPNAADVVAAAARGEKPGGDIMIHGLPNGFGIVGGLHRRLDWTAGCIAVTDAAIEEIWRDVADGTPIEIRP